MLHDDDVLRVVALAAVDETVPPSAWRLAMGLAWTVHLGVLAASVVGGVRCARQRFRRILSG